MNLSKINEIKESRVFLRVDFDVPINKDTLESTYRIDRCKDTINSLIKNKNKIVLFTKLGRPEKKEKNLSTINLIPYLNKIFPDLFFVRNVDELEAAMEIKDNNLILYENTRFFNWEKYPKDNIKTIEKIASLFNIYVDEAFAMSHRKEPSNFNIPFLINKIALGINYEQETKNLQKIKLGQFNKPAVFILGGAKPETKTPMINSLTNKFTYFLVGGKLASTQEIKNISKSNKNVVVLQLNDKGFDINTKSAEITARAIMLAKTVVWNGPVGMFESPEYSNGTRSIIKAINNKKTGYVLAGGGDTITSIEKLGNFDNFSFISTGGGAMFSYLSGKETNIECLIKK